MEQLASLSEPLFCVNAVDSGEEPLLILANCNLAVLTIFFSIYAKFTQVFPAQMASQFRKKEFG